MQPGALGWSTIGLLLLLSTLWGANMGAIKLASQEMSPLFMVGLR